MFANFYPDSAPEEAEEFAAAVDGGEVRSEGCHQANNQLPQQMQSDTKMAPKVDTSDSF